MEDDHDYLEPQNVCDALKNNHINFCKTGIKHGTITALLTIIILK